MKSLSRLSSVLIVLIASASCLFAQASTSIIIEFSPSEHRLKINAQLQDSFAVDSSRVTFLLSQRVDSLQAAFLSFTDSVAVTVHREAGDTAWVDLPSPPPTPEWRLQFDYQLPLDSNRDSLILLDRGHRWYPVFHDRLTTTWVNVTMPDTFDVLSVGDMVDGMVMNGTRIASFESDVPVFKIPLLIYPVGYFNEGELPCALWTIELYSRSLSDSLAAEIANEACSTLVYMCNWIGDYNRSDLTLVETADFPGMNIGSGIVTIGSEMIQGFGQGYVDGLHLCIAQQWFGAGAFVRFPSRGFWLLTVALPHQLRITYELRNLDQKGKHALWLRALDPAREIFGTDKDLPLLDIDMPDAPHKGALLYTKGPAAFELLHRCLGEDNWNRFLRDFYFDHKGRMFDWDKFVEALLRYDREAECLPAFKNVMSTTGLPNLE